MSVAAGEDIEKSEAAVDDIGKAEALARLRLVRILESPGYSLASFHLGWFWKNCGRQGEKDSTEGKGTFLRA